MIDQTFLLSAFATLFVVLDPLALTPVFVTLTHGMTQRERVSVAVRCCLTAVAILLIFALFGEAVLGFIGISMAAFRVAGGALLFLTALDMLFERRTKRREDRAEEREDPAIFPLAVPLVAGPGSIASVILLTGEAGDTWLGFAAVSAMMVTVMTLTFMAFLGAGLLERALGKTGLSIITRVLGMLLAALAVQFVLDGLAAFGFATRAPISAK